MALTIVKKEISLNVGQPNNFELLCAMQGDNKSFEITATLYDANKLYTINTNNIKMKGENPVGLTILKNVDSHTANTVTFTLTEDMLMYDGLLKLVLVFAESSTQLTTFPFVIKVVNSPGSNTADDIKTVSALVEEAKKWAMTSKSYAVGTENEVRDGDKTDNSKYYYEQSKKAAYDSKSYADNSKDYYDQIQSLINSGAIGEGSGNAKILYYDTYEEFKADLDAGKIPDETLICIKESVLDTAVPDEPSIDDTNPTNKKLLFFSTYDHSYTTDDMQNWEYIGTSTDMGYVQNTNYIPSIASNNYQLVYCNNMLFCLSYNNNSDKYILCYTIHDFDKGSTDVIWKNISPPTNDNNSYAGIAYGNKHFIFASKQGIYVTNDEAIQRDRETEITFNKSFTKMTGINSVSVGNLEFGNNIFVLTQSSGNSIMSWYSADCKTWKEIGNIRGWYTSNEKRKLIYGNGIFIDFRVPHTGKYVFAVLNSNKLTEGWFYPENSVLPDSNSLVVDYSNGTEEICITDIVYDDKNMKFLAPYYDRKNNTSGFYIYDGINWSSTAANGKVLLYNCYVDDGKLYGFTYDEHWVRIDNIDTYQFTDYGLVQGIYKNINMFSRYIGDYASIETPLWDIDKTGTNEPETIEVGTNIDDWNFEFDQTNKTVELIKYVGSDSDVTVYGKYKIETGIHNGQVIPEEIICQTKIARTPGGTAESSKMKFYMFANNTNIKSITFNKGIDTTETYLMSYMFYKCSNLTKLDISNLDTSHVIKFDYMFYGTSSQLNNVHLDLTNFDTSSVESMDNMFNQAMVTSVDLSSFDTSKVKRYTSMFYGATNLTELKISSSTWTIPTGYPFGCCVPESCTIIYV